MDILILRLGSHLYEYANYLRSGFVGPPLKLAPCTIRAKLVTLVKDPVFTKIVVI